MEKLVLANFTTADLDDAQWTQLRAVANEVVLVDRGDGGDSADFIQQISDAEGLIVKVASKVPAAVFEAAPKLKYVGIYATGYGGIDMSAATAAQVTVTNVAGYSSTAVAELTIAMIIGQLRSIPEELARAAGGEFTEPAIPGSQLSGRTVGLVGLGSIGRAVARILTGGFNCRVLYTARSRKHELETESIAFVPLDELVRTVDVISVHAPAGNAPILGAAEIASLAPNAVLINTSPNETLDMGAVEERLRIGDLRFSFDHTDEMPSTDALRLSAYEGCTAYTPMGYVTEEADAAKRAILVDNLVGFTSGNPVNVVS